MSSWWLGVCAGGLIMGVHGLLRIVAHRLALRTDTQHAFLRVTVGGLLVRMAAVLGLTILTLSVAPVHPMAFAGTLVSLLVLSLVLETALLARRMNDRPRD